MNKATELFDKILVDGQEINLQQLDANNGVYSAGSQKTIKVDFILKKKDEIPAKLFNGLTSLKTVVIPESVKTIGERAFASTGAEISGLSNVESFGEAALSGTIIDENVLEQIQENSPEAVAELYTAEEAVAYNLTLNGAKKYGDVKTPATEAVSEHWVMNGQSYNEDPTYEELSTFETIDDETSWNESFENGVLKSYYEKNPSEDVWNTNENRACNFNDKIYTVEQYDNAECEGEGVVKQYKAQWYSDNGVQKIIDVEDNSIEYYIPTFFDTPTTIFELFAGAEGGYVATPENLVNSCDKWIKVTDVSFGGEGVGPAYAGWVANGAQTPWIAISFVDDANVKPIFKYTGKDDVYPWGDKVFGTGEGHKAWGIASLPQEFGEGTYDVANLQIILEHQDVEHIEAAEAQEAVLYTNEEVDAYNAQLIGAVKAGDIKVTTKPEYDPWEDYQENQTVNGEVNSEDDGNTQIYNGD